ncbi:MAG: myxosortase-dependent metalloprotease, MXAN_2677/MXAN_2678 family [Myxococcales bacterium]
MRAALLVSATLMFLVSEAQAFVRARVPTASSQPPGPYLHWANPRVPMVVNKLGSRDAGHLESLAAVRASYAAWNEVECSDFELVHAGTTAKNEAGFDPVDNTNLIIWREVACDDVVPPGDPCFVQGGCNNKYDCWDESSSVVGVATITFSFRTGEIVDADIELNGAGFVFTTVDSPECLPGRPIPRPASCVATDVQNTVTHELGHVIGLADVYDDPGATLYWQAEIGETAKRTLSQDDIDGLCAVYPRGSGLSVDEPHEDAAKGCTCGGSGAPPAALVALPLALGLVRRRRAARA